MNHTIVTAVFLAALVVFAVMIALCLIASERLHVSDFWAGVNRKVSSNYFIGALVIVSIVPAVMNYDNVPIRALAEFCWSIMDAGWVFSGATIVAVVMGAFLITCVFAIGCIVAFSMDICASVKRAIREQRKAILLG